MYNLRIISQNVPNNNVTNKHQLLESVLKTKHMVHELLDIFYTQY